MKPAHDVPRALENRNNIHETDDKKHNWYPISMNYISKWCVRNVTIVVMLQISTQFTEDDWYVSYASRHV